MGWACEQGIVREAESDQFRQTLEALYDAIRVDAFEAEGLKALSRCAQGKRKVVERPPREEE